MAKRAAKKAAPAKRVRALSAENERFCQLYIRLGNATRAYMASRNNQLTAKPETLWANASRLLAREDIQSRIAVLQERATELAGLSIARLTTDLQQTRNLAMELENPSAAVSATMGIAKINGLIVDRAEVTGKDGAAIQVNEELSQEDRTAFDIGRRVMWLLSQGRKRIGKPPETIEA